MSISDDEFLKEIGRRLKNLRTDHKLSRDDVALGAEISRKTIKAIEEGARNYRVSSFGKLCFFYHVNPCDILKGL